MFAPSSSKSSRSEPRQLENTPPLSPDTQDAAGHDDNARTNAQPEPQKDAPSQEGHQVTPVVYPSPPSNQVPSTPGSSKPQQPGATDKGLADSTNPSRLSPLSVDSLGVESIPYNEAITSSRSVPPNVKQAASQVPATLPKPFPGETRRPAPRLRPPSPPSEVPWKQSLRGPERRPVVVSSPTARSFDLDYARAGLAATSAAYSRPKHHRKPSLVDSLFPAAFENAIQPFDALPPTYNLNIVGGVQPALDASSTRFAERARRERVRARYDSCSMLGYPRQNHYLFTNLLSRNVVQSEGKMPCNPLEKVGVEVAAEVAVNTEVMMRSTTGPRAAAADARFRTTVAVAVAVETAAEVEATLAERVPRKQLLQ